MATIIGKKTSLDGVMLWPPTKSVKEITGKKFGRLLVTGTGWKKGVAAESKYYVSCICDCGEDCIVGVLKLKSGHTQSCGCLHTEKILKSVTKHGESNWRYKDGRKGPNFYLSYSKWQSVKARCLYPSTEGYVHYGAKGITICNGYRYDYDLFKSDLGEQPSIKHTLDRINTYGSYSCGKCGQCKENGWDMNIRWADEDTQNNNKRNSIWIEYNGEILTAAQWGRRLNIKAEILRARIKNGWSHYDTINTPVGKFKGGSRKKKNQ